jgi:hypothetical protein
MNNNNYDEEDTKGNLEVLVMAFLSITLGRLGVDAKRNLDALIRVNVFLCDLSFLTS